MKEDINLVGNGDNVNTVLPHRKVEKKKPWDTKVLGRQSKSGRNMYQNKNRRMARAKEPNKCRNKYI